MLPRPSARAWARPEILEAAKEGIFALRKGGSQDSLEHIGTVLIKVFDQLNESWPSQARIFRPVYRPAGPGQKKSTASTSRISSSLPPGPVWAKPPSPSTSLSTWPKKTDKTVAFSLWKCPGTAGHAPHLQRELCGQPKLVSGNLTEEEWGKIGLASSALSQTDIRVDDNPTITVAEMNAKCRRLDNLGLVLVDYLQLMNSANGKVNENRVLAVSEISQSARKSWQRN